MAQTPQTNIYCFHRFAQIGNAPRFLGVLGVPKFVSIRDVTFCVIRGLFLVAERLLGSVLYQSLAVWRGARGRKGRRCSPRSRMFCLSAGAVGGRHARA